MTREDPDAAAHPGPPLDCDDPGTVGDAHPGGGREGRTERQAYLKGVADGLAHELKNPLSTLRMNLQLLGEDIADDDSILARRVRKRAEIIEMQTRRIQETLDEFLRFARGEPLELVACDVNEVLQELLDFTAAERPRSDIRLLTDLRDDVREIVADTNLLKQALLNIIINAQQAMPEGGELIIRTARRGDAVEIQITDTGAGIPPEDQSRVFQIYYSTKEGGTGLGLATARRIVEQHDGTIRLYSAVGKGTNFVITLPADGPHGRERQSQGEDDAS